MSARVPLLALVTATMTIGAFFIQGWRAAQFAFLGAAVVSCLLVLASRRSPQD